MKKVDYYRTIFYFYKDLYFDLTGLQEQIFLGFDIPNDESYHIYMEIRKARKQILKRITELKEVIENE